MTGNTVATLSHAILGTTAANNTAVLLYWAPCSGRILKAGFIVSEAVTVSAAVLTVYVRPSPVTATETNRRTVGTITVPVTSSTIGDVVRNGVLTSDADAEFNPGEVLEISLTTVGGGAGKGVAYLAYEPYELGAMAEADATGKAKPARTNAIGRVKTVIA